MAAGQGDRAVAARLKAFTGHRWNDEGMLLEALADAAASKERMAEAFAASRCAYHYGNQGLFELGELDRAASEVVPKVGRDFGKTKASMLPSSRPRCAADGARTSMRKGISACA